MGLGISKSSWSGDIYVRSEGDPPHVPRTEDTKYRFSVLDLKTIGDTQAVKLYCPSCDHLGGMKILVVDCVSRDWLTHRCEFDPHFKKPRDEAKPNKMEPVLVGRFPPTDLGWKMALLCAERYNNMEAK